jgi:hypothetical protein
MRTLSKSFLAPILFLLLIPVQLMCQPPSQVQTKEPVYEDYRFTDFIGVTLHRLVGGEVGPALDPMKDDLKFYEGDRFVLRYKGNFPAYVYFTSISAAGVNLAYPRTQADIKPIENSGISRDFVFRLQGAPGNERIILFASKSPIAGLDEKIRAGNFKLSDPIGTSSSPTTQPATPSTTTQPATPSKTPATSSANANQWWKQLLQTTVGQVQPVSKDLLAKLVSKIGNLIFKEPVFDVEVTNQINARPAPEVGKNNAARLGSNEVLTFQISYEYMGKRP